jgi:glucokinase
MASRKARREFELLNDVEALAYALVAPSPPARTLREGAPALDGARIVVALGTGLGLAQVIGRGRSAIVQATEAGHATAAPPDVTFLAPFETHMRRKGRLAVENVLSGPGLINLRASFASLEGDERAFDHLSTTRDIIAGARADANSSEARATDAFARLLGSFCGDCALAYAAHGGVYLAGSFINAMSDLITTKAFTDAYEKKGLMSDFVAPIPVRLLTAEEPVLQGLLAYASRSSR